MSRRFSPKRHETSGIKGAFKGTKVPATEFPRTCYNVTSDASLGHLSAITYGSSIALAIHSLDPTELCEKETEF